MTPAFGTAVMGASALIFYLVLSFASQNTLADSIASLGLAVAFYYGITAFSCVWYFRRTLFDSARNFFMRGLFPLFGGIGGVFILGVGMLVLGVPLMLACCAADSDFFKGKTLNANTEVKVPDVY